MTLFGMEVETVAENFFEKVQRRLWCFLVRVLPGNEVKNRILRRRVYHIGKNTSLNGSQFGAEPWLLWIGDNVIAAIGTVFVEHDASYLNICRYLHRDPVPGGGKMDAIIVRDNVFIGANSIIMGGADIGENSVVAACSLIKSKIPPNEVWGGTRSFHYDCG